MRRPKGWQKALVPQELKLKKAPRKGQRQPRVDENGNSVVAHKADASGPRPSHWEKRKGNGEGGARQQERGHGDASTSSGPRPWTCTSDIDRQAAYAIMRVLEGQRTKRGANIKSLTLGPQIKAPRATYKVTCETLKFLAVLRELVGAARLLEDHPKLTEETALVLAYEAVIGEGLRPTGSAERAVVAALPALKAALASRMKAAGARTPADLLPKEVTQGPPPRPRTVRVNLLKTTVKEALAELKASGHVDASLDPHLDDVIVLPPGADLHAHPLVSSGRAVLQSKASCMPARALDPEPGWHVMDCCAAPGNKTTHVASRLGVGGKVFAFDKDPKRLNLLRTNVHRAGASSIIEPHLADFLTLDLSDPKYAKVKGVILDPSCSGSGTAVSRMDHLLHGVAESDSGAADGGAGGAESDKERVEALAQFQEKAIRHALTLPALQRLVYSTCSVHSRENEEVVAAVLGEARERGFELAAALPGWPRRGLPVVEGHEKLARTDMIEDGTDGFFLAVFERAGAGSGKGKAADDGPDSATAQGKKGKKRAKAGADDGAAKEAEVPSEAAPSLTSASGKKKRRKDGGA